MLFESPVYIHEWKQLTYSEQVRMLQILNTYYEIISPDFDRAVVWAKLQDEISEEFKVAHRICREKGLKNLRAWLGRKWNMFANLPLSFEEFNGRIYDIGY